MLGTSATIKRPQTALVIFSGGQDSTTCLFQVIAEFGKENVEVMTFQYGQRHAIELEKGLNEYLTEKGLANV